MNEPTTRRTWPETGRSVLALVDGSAISEQVVREASTTGLPVIVLDVTSDEVFERRQQSRASVPQLWEEGGYYLEQAVADGRGRALGLAYEILAPAGVPFLTLGHVGNRVDAITSTVARYGSQAVYLSLPRSAWWWGRRDRTLHRLRRSLDDDIDIEVVPVAPSRGRHRVPSPEKVP